MRQASIAALIAGMLTAGASAAVSDTRASVLVNETDILGFTQASNNDSDPWGLALLSDRSFVYFENEPLSVNGLEALIRIQYATSLASTEFSVIASEAAMLAAIGAGTDLVSPRDLTSDANDNVYISASAGGTNQSIIRIPDTNPGPGFTYGPAAAVVQPGVAPAGATAVTAIDVDDATGNLYCIIDAGTAADTTTNGIYRVSASATNSALTLVQSYSQVNAGWGQTTSTLGSDDFGAADLCVLPDGSLALTMSFMLDEPVDGTILRIADPAGTPATSVLISGSALEAAGGTNFGNFGQLLIECNAAGDLYIFHHEGDTSAEGILRYTYAGGTATFQEVYCTEQQLLDTADPLISGVPNFTINGRSLAIGDNRDLYVTMPDGEENMLRIRNHAGVPSALFARAQTLLRDDILASYNVLDDDFDSDPSGCALLSTGAIAFFESETNDGPLGNEGTEDSILLYDGLTVTVIASEQQIQGVDPNDAGSSFETALTNIRDIVADANDNLYVLCFEDTSGAVQEECIFRIPSTGPNTFGAPQLVAANGGAAPGQGDGPGGTDGAVAIDIDLATNTLYVLRDAAALSQGGEVPFNAVDATNTGLFRLNLNTATIPGDNALTQVSSGATIGAAITPPQTPTTLGLDDLVIRTNGGVTDAIVSAPLVGYSAALGGLDGDLVRVDLSSGAATLFCDSSVWTAALEAATASSTVGAAILEAADLDGGDGNEEIIVMASALDGVIDADRAEAREGIVEVSADGTTAALFADQLDLYLVESRLAGGGDLSVFANGIDFDPVTETLFVMFSNTDETLMRIFMGDITAAFDWQNYR